MRIEALELSAVAQELGIDGQEEPWRAGWEESARSCGQAPSGWMEREPIETACRSLSMSRDNREACLEAREWIASSPARIRAAWHCWHCIFLSVDVRGRIADRWPRLPQAPASLFYAVVLLSALPLTEAKHRSLGIPRETAASTMRDLELWIEDFRAKHGRPGFEQTDWLRLHFTGRLYQIERLQFEITINAHPFRVLRRRGTAELLILAESGLAMRADGCFADADGGTEGSAALTTELEEDTETLTGFPVSPDGRLEPTTVTLRRDDWQCVLERTDPVLGVHIPAAGRFHGPMDPDSCARSFRNALPFFAMHFPEHRFRGFTCTSWIMDGQLQSILSPESNILRFQERFRLIPVRGATDGQTMERIFGGPVSDWSIAPRGTSLQRAVADAIQAGGRFRSGGGLIPTGSWKDDARSRSL